MSDSKSSSTWTGELWAGGRVLGTSKGRRFVIEKRTPGRRWVLTLPGAVNNAAKADVELRMFLAGPERYAEALALVRLKRQAPKPAPASAKGAAALAWSFLDAFAAHLAETKSPEYARSAARYTRWWQRKLASKPLEQVSLADLQRALGTVSTGRKARIIALKSLTHWLRATGRLAPAADPTLALSVPASRPGKAASARAYSKATIQSCYRRLKTPLARDTFRVLASTGMHLQELRRIAAAGAGALTAVKGTVGVGGVVRYVHKNGGGHATTVDASTFAALQRLVQGRRCLSRKALLTACAPLQPGRLRHSWSTLAMTSGRVVKQGNGGVAREAVADALGHSAATNRKYYDGVAVPARIDVGLRLR